MGDSGASQARRAIQGAQGDVLDTYRQLLGIDASGAQDPNSTFMRALDAARTSVIQRQPLDPNLNLMRMNAAIAQGQLNEQEAFRQVNSQAAAQGGQARAGTTQRQRQDVGVANAAQTAGQVQQMGVEGQAQQAQQSMANIAPALSVIGSLNAPTLAAMQQLLSQGQSFTANAQNTPTGAQIAGGFVPLIGAGIGGAAGK